MTCVWCHGTHECCACAAYTTPDGCAHCQGSGRCHACLELPLRRRVGSDLTIDDASQDGMQMAVDYFLEGT